MALPRNPAARDNIAVSPGHGPAHLAELTLIGYNNNGTREIPNVPGQPSLAGTVLQTLVA